jgi:hypothetical protein
MAAGNRAVVTGMKLCFTPFTIFNVRLEAILGGNACEYQGSYDYL